MDEKKMNVLIIEDNPADARLVREILKEGRGNFTTSVVERLKESSKLLASRDIDLVLLDLNLPDSHGLITFTELQNRFPHIPIVVQTSIDNEELGQQAVRLGAQDYIVKGGVDAELLRRSLAYAVERKRAQEALLTERDNLRDSQRAALNIMEDAITARRQAEVLNIELKREITERKKAQEEIKKLARFPAENPNPVLRFSQDGRILFSNGPGGVLLEKWNSRVGEIVPPEWRQIIQEVLRTKREKVLDIEYGERVYLTVVAPISEGKYVNLYGRDVTKERQAQEALQKANDDLEIRVKERTVELQRANEQLMKEIKERVRTEQSLRLEEARLDTLLRLSRMSEEPLDKITSFTLEQAVALTQSKIGFLGFLNEEETVYTLHSVSKDVVQGCNVTGNPMHWPVADAGIWADAIRQRKTLFINDYSKPHPRKKGIPAGHVPIERFMVVPVFEGEKIVALAGVGNKERNYDKSDERQITLLLNGMWSCTQKNRAQEALRSSALYMRALLEASLDPLVTISRDRKIIDVNVATETATGLSRESLIGTNFSDCFTEPENARLGFEKVLSEGHIRDYPLTIKHVSGNTTDMLYNATIYKNEAGQVQGIFAAAHDITERKKAENRSRLTNLLLELFAQKTTRKEYLDSAVKAVHDWNGCQCVGIRLVDSSEHIPYESSVGFSREFLNLENKLSLKMDTCACIRAITQTPHAQDKPLMTSKGSFHSSNIFEFVDSLAKQAKKQYRGNCIKCGFASLALIPIYYRGKVIGALHLADKQNGKFPLDTVEFLESITLLIGEAIHRFDTEAALRISESRLIEAQRIASIGNWDWNVIENKLWWSDEVYRIFGLVSHEFGATYDAFLYYVHPQDRELVKASVNDALYNHRAYGLDYRVIRPDGEQRIVHAQGRVTFDTKGKPVRMIGTLQDVTDVRQNERAVRESEQRFRALTDAIEDVFWISTPEITEVIYVSPAYEKIWGRSRESLYKEPQSFISAVHPDEREELIRGLEKHAQGIWDFEYRIIRPDGSIRWIRDRGFPIRDEKGDLYLMCGVATDISGRKEAEQKILADQELLRSLTSKLELAQEIERRRIAADLHDSIAQIMAFSTRELDRVQQKAPQQIAGNLREIKNQLDNAIKQTRTLTFDLSPNTLYDLGFEIAVEELAEKFEKERNIRCIFKNSRKQKPLDDSVKILLYRSIRELLINVAKHAQAKSVMISLDRVNNDISIVVTDDGMGFDAQNLQHKMGEPKGFGIFSIRERLTYIGGKFEIQSVTGRGTKVTLQAPLKQ